MYIINPWFFYLVEVIPKIGTALLFISIGGLFISLLCLACFAGEGEDTSTPKKYLIAFVISFITSILFPSKETIYKMGIASITTKDNIKIAVTESKELYNFLKDEIADAAKFIIDYQNRKGENKNAKNK